MRKISDRSRGASPSGWLSINVSASLADSVCGAPSTTSIGTVRSGLSRRYSGPLCALVAKSTRALPLRRARPGGSESSGSPGVPSARRIIMGEYRAPPVRLFGHPGQTQAFGEMLAVTRLLQDEPGHEAGYRRLRLNGQAVRHQFPSAFDKAQLRAASRHHGRRGGFLVHPGQSLPRPPRSGASRTGRPRASGSTR